MVVRAAPTAVIKGFEMRLFLCLAALAATTACTPANLRDQPEAGAATDPFAQQAAPMAAPMATDPATPQAIPSSEINSALFGTSNGPAVAVPPAPQSANPAPASSATFGANVPAANPAVKFDGSEAALIAALPSHQGLSDEQDFNAVSARETIEADKARLAANRAAYQEIAPTALPERVAANEVPTIVAYALQAPNHLGQALYKRRSSASVEASQKTCLGYPSDDAAQEAFLKAGGPERDPKNLDPDGDGFACTWDPTPFQKARGG